MKFHDLYEQIIAWNRFDAHLAHGRTNLKSFKEGRFLAKSPCSSSRVMRWPGLVFGFTPPLSISLVLETVLNPNGKKSAIDIACEIARVCRTVTSSAPQFLHIVSVLPMVGLLL